MSQSMMYSGEGREQIPDLLRSNGIGVELLPGASGQEKMRCRRGDVTVLLIVARVVPPKDMVLSANQKSMLAMLAYEVNARADSTGWKFWLWGAANRLEGDVLKLITQGRKGSPQ
jgi:hypothetical protein